MTTRRILDADITDRADGRTPVWSAADGTHVYEDIAAPETPPGTEVDHVEITSGVSITGTTEGAPTTIITGTSQAYANVPHLVHFYSAGVDFDPNAAGDNLVFILTDGGTVVTRLAFIIPDSGTASRQPVCAHYPFTPTADTHQYIVKAYKTAGTASVGAGSGGSGGNPPAFLRITRA